MTRWIILGLGLVAAVAAAVTPGEWMHSTEADFAEGEFEHTVVNSLGQVFLAREIEILIGSDVAPPVISALVVRDKDVYVSSATSNVIYAVAGKKLTELARPPGAMVATLAIDDGALLAGTGGPDAGIYLIDASGDARRIWADDEVKYVWAIVPGPDGVLYAATGPEAKVFAIESNGQAECIYEADKKLAKNVLCLARSADGLLYAGTDENGLVIEVNPRTKASRILLDADEKEIAAIVPDGDGGLYVGTSDAAKAAADGEAAPSDENAGKAPKALPSTQPASMPAETRMNDELDSQHPKDDEAIEAGPRGLESFAEEDEEAPEEPDEAPRRPTPVRPSGPRPKGKGNAVYHIKPDGLVRAIFRRPVTILSMLAVGEKLLLGTGNGGDIYSVSADGDEISRDVDTDARQVTSLACDEGGKVVFATSNKGSVGSMGTAYARKGTYTSVALDAEQIARWGSLKCRASASKGAAVAVATRSGNVREPDDATWSEWSQNVPVADAFLPVDSKAGRFIQYRLTLTGDGDVTPVVEQAELIYQVANLIPSIDGVTVEPTSKAGGGVPKTEGPQVYRLVKIKASDANKDELVYKIEFRQTGTESWIVIDEDLKEPKYTWDTRTVGDGAYQLRVTASDSPSNPPASALQAVRISELVVVDNTAPVIESLAVAPAGGAADVTGRATDAGSRIVAVHYAVDSQADWVAVLPTDGMSDSASEEFAFGVEDLKDGPHRIAVRVEDLYGNTGYAAVTITVGQ